MTAGPAEGTGWKPRISGNDLTWDGDPAGWRRARVPRVLEHVCSGRVLAA